MPITPEQLEAHENFHAKSTNTPLSNAPDVDSVTGAVPLTEANIEYYEKLYDVDIRTVGNDGRYEVETNKSVPGGFFNPESFSDRHCQYQVQTKPLEGTFDINEKVADYYNVELTGNTAQDVANIMREGFDRKSTLEDFSGDHPDYIGSHLQRSAQLGAWIRSDGQIPPEAWAADPSFGASGAGPDIVHGGGQGGILSRIGPAHDTDYTLGAYGSMGPMSALAEVDNSHLEGDEKGRPASGLHGIPHTAEVLSQFFQPENYEARQNEREQVDDLDKIDAYDSPRKEHSDWDVDIIYPRGIAISDTENTVSEHPPGAALEVVQRALDAGMPPEQVRSELERTEDAVHNSENDYNLQTVSYEGREDDGASII